MNARKVAVPELAILDLVKQVNKIYASIGKKVIFFDLKQKQPDRDELFKAICRNGKLRAPALRMGKILIVGFDEETYGRLFN